MIVKRLNRVLGFAASFLAGIYAVWSLSTALLKATKPSRMPMALDVVPIVQSFRSGIPHDGKKRVAVVGDSVLLPEIGKESVPMKLESALARGRGPKPAIHVLSWPALGPISEYCLLDEIIATRPDAVVLEVNLRALGARPLGSMGFPELAGYIHARRLFEAAFLPLNDAGITLDRLLMYRALFAGGARERWINLQDRQARLTHVRDVLEDRIERATHSNVLYGRRFAVAALSYAKYVTPRKHRLTHLAALGNMRPALEGVAPADARLRVLAATLERLREAGIPTLVWAPPVNVQHLGSLGFSSDGLSRSAKSLGVTVKAGGAAFADLHGILDDDAFIDSGDHLTADGSPDGVRAVADRLAKEIVKLLGRNRAEADTTKRAANAVQ